MEIFNPLQQIIIYAIPILFAITVHEVAHGWVANLLGDPTAKMLGRLTLNPIKHIDPIGTIVVPALLYFLGGFIFGWAKPVPITWRNLKHPKRDTALVAVAGPLANLMMVLIWALLIKGGALLKDSSPTFALVTLAMGEVGVRINLILMVLNLIPIPPLDGSRVLSSFLPGPASYQFNRLEPYGFFILLILLATNILTYILVPPVVALEAWVFSWVGV